MLESFKAVEFVHDLLEVATAIAGIEHTVIPIEAVEAQYMAIESEADRFAVSSVLQIVQTKLMQCRSQVDAYIQECAARKNILDAVDIIIQGQQEQPAAE